MKVTAQFLMILALWLPLLISCARAVENKCLYRLEVRHVGAVPVIKFNGIKINPSQLRVDGGQLTFFLEEDEGVIDIYASDYTFIRADLYQDKMGDQTKVRYGGSGRLGGFGLGPYKQTEKELNVKIRYSSDKGARIEDG